MSLVSQKNYLKISKDVPMWRHVLSAAVGGVLRSTLSEEEAPEPGSGHGHTTLTLSFMPLSCSL